MLRFFPVYRSSFATSVINNIERGCPARLVGDHPPHDDEASSLSVLAVDEFDPSEH